MVHLELFEAFALNKAKALTKQWKESGAEERYDNLFGKGIYRIYLPFSSSKEDLEAYEKTTRTHELYYDISSCLNTNGYKIISYTDGTADKIDGNSNNIFKIGKLLQRFEPTLKPKFDSDKFRDGAKILQQPLSICISRHAYDIGGMSTGRGWTSCMNLEDGGNCHFVPRDITEGTIIAYLVKSTDKNIKNPISRILIKPFVKTVDAKTTKTVLHPETKMYGTTIESFYDNVLKWCNQINPKAFGSFSLNPNLYADGGRDFINLSPDGYDVISSISDDLLVVSEHDSDEMILMDSEGNQLLNGKSYSLIKRLDDYANITYITTYEDDGNTCIVNSEGKVVYKYNNPDKALPVAAGNGLFVVEPVEGKILIDFKGEIVLTGVLDISIENLKHQKYLLIKKDTESVLFDKSTYEEISIQVEDSQKLRVRQLGSFITVGDGSDRRLYSVKSNTTKVIGYKVSLPMNMENNSYVIKFLDKKNNRSQALISNESIYKLPLDTERSVDYAYLLKKGLKTDIIVTYKQEGSRTSSTKTYLYSIKKKCFLFDDKGFDEVNFVTINYTCSNVIVAKDFREGLYDLFEEKIILPPTQALVQRVYPLRKIKGIFFKYAYYDEKGTALQGIVDDTGKIIIKPTTERLVF